MNINDVAAVRFVVELLLPFKGGADITLKYLGVSDRLENLYTALMLYDERFLEDPGNWSLKRDDAEIVIGWRAVGDTKCQLRVYDNNGVFDAYAYYYAPFSGFTAATRLHPGGMAFSGVHEFDDWHADDDMGQKEGESDFDYIDRIIGIADDDPPDEENVPQNVAYPEPEERDYED